MTCQFAVHIDVVHGTGLQQAEDGNPVLGENGKPVDNDKSGSWVLGLRQGEDFRDEVLIADDDTHVLTWYPMADCRVIRVQTPDMPSMVMTVVPKEDPTKKPTKLVTVNRIVEPNRQQRRHPSQ